MWCCAALTTSTECKIQKVFSYLNSSFYAYLVGVGRIMLLRAERGSASIPAQRNTLKWWRSIALSTIFDFIITVAAAKHSISFWNSTWTTISRSISVRHSSHSCCCCIQHTILKKHICHCRTHLHDQHGHTEMMVFVCVLINFQATTNDLASSWDACFLQTDGTTFIGDRPRQV